MNLKMNVIKLSQNKEALVDAEDYESLNQFKWHYRKGYAVRSGPRINGKQYPVRMSRIIARAKKGESVDHINGDKLDNRKENLRICSHKENMRNRKKGVNTSSRYKGVYKKGKVWHSQINVDNKKIYLGRFEQEEDAANAYNVAAIKYFGKYSRLNNA